MNDPDPTVAVLRGIWAAEGADESDLEAIAGPPGRCKNMREVGFDETAGSPEDLRRAWRERLEAEGKLGGEATIRDLVLGPDADA